MNFHDSIQQHKCIISSSMDYQKQVEDIKLKTQVTVCDGKVQKCEGFKKRGKCLKKINFQIQCTEEGELQYVYQGEILQRIKFNDQLTKPQTITNLEEIFHLLWVGVQEKNQQKAGQWIAMWKGENLFGCGGQYSSDGKKQGIWKEMIKDFYENSKAFEIGEYVNGQRKGYWKYVYENIEIGGGEYNQQGERNGKWIELGDGFWRDLQVIYIGEYKNGKKIGKWDILMQILQKNLNISGGGLYHERSFNKIGKWIELSDGFNYESQVTYNGEYNTGKKVGRWDILFSRHDWKQHFEKIGGGSYDEGGQIKIGKWIELGDGLKYDSQITHHGEYKNDKKVGRWDIFFRHDWKNQFEKIGGGQYDQESSLKTGNWIEISDGFSQYSQVIYTGEYQNGKKVSKWDILFRDIYSYSKYQEIGGGEYDEGGQMKIGRWIELSDGFRDVSQVTIVGEYQNGEKAGRWDIKFEGRQFGGGSFHDSIKTGKWIELIDEFTCYSFVTYQGQYHNGQKVGQWEIYYMKSDGSVCQQIGGGQYDQESSLKIGKWIEQSDGFSEYSQVIYNGEYINGRKIGKWEIDYRDNSDQSFIQIGGGQYDEASSTKIGRWIELNDGFTYYSQVIYNGEYINSKKVGQWDAFFRNIQSNSIFEKIGGGLYDEDGINKIGRWIELSDGFRDDQQVKYVGDYKNGKKIGMWTKMERNWQKIEDGFRKVKQERYDK
ncbi:unnamed protein product [Paramecium pentaurelia]|uniref:Uncharacterized protein n=1 Tax=Paramecium pentaurelia TaxID=43138 RepID=A0A8S1UMN8_9CILI|nr:unnamed protein product [Paramecium pentaurelia]